MPIGKNIIYLCKALMIAYVIMLLSMFGISLVVWKFDLGDSVLRGAVIFLYVFSAIAAGIYIGKKKREKKFLWGMMTGCLYFLILFVLTVFSGDFSGRVGMEFATAFFICTFSGTLGGMVA